jgi:hypothetical protein
MTMKFDLSPRPAARLSRRAGRAHEFFSPLEPRQMMAGDLGVEIADSFAPLAFYVPGETISVPVVVRNNFADANPAGTQMRVTVELLSGNVVTISREVLAVAPLAPDAATTVTVPIPVLAFGDDALTPGEFNLRASVEFVSTAIVDDFEGDNTTNESVQLDIRWAFGAFGGRTGLTFRSADSDGTTYSISTSGGGGGEINIGDGVQPLLVFFSSGPSSVLNIAATGKLPGSAGAEADPFVDLTADVVIQRLDTAPASEATFGGVNAPALNFTGDFSDDMLDGVQMVPYKLTNGPMTFRDFTGSFSTSSAGIGNFTTNDFTGSFDIGVDFNLPLAPVAGAVRFNSFTGFAEGFAVSDLDIDGSVASLAITLDVTDATLFIGGNVGAFTVRDLISSGVTIGGNVASITARNLSGGVNGTFLDVNGTAGPVTLGNLSNADLYFDESGGAFTAGNLLDSNIYYGGIIPSFTAANLLGDENSVEINNQLGRLRFGRTVAMTLGNITSTVYISVNGHLSTLSINKWDVADTSTLGAGSISALSAGSVIVRGVTPAGVTDPAAGRTEGEFIFTGGTGRASAVDSVNINGLFTGLFLAGGSVGSFTARGIDTFDGDLVQPSVVVGGTLRTFTLSNTTAPAAPLQTRAAVWARNLTTVTANIGGAGSSFEVAAGARFSPSDVAPSIMKGSLLAAVDDLVDWGSGSIGTLNLNLRPGSATTNFTGRFTAGIDAGLASPNRNVSGRLTFANAARTVTSTTISRINTINVTGAAAAGGNSVQFGFISYSATAFTYAGTANTRISTTLPTTAPGFITSSAGFTVPAETFFRLGRPVT